MLYADSIIPSISWGPRWDRYGRKKDPAKHHHDSSLCFLYTPYPLAFSFLFSILDPKTLRVSIRLLFPRDDL